MRVQLLPFHLAILPWICLVMYRFINPILTRFSTIRYYIKQSNDKCRPSIKLSTLRPRKVGRHFPDDIFICIFSNKKVSISIKTSLNFIRNGPINSILSLVQIMGWRRPSDKPLSKPMMVSLQTHICVTRPQWFSTFKWHSVTCLKLRCSRLSACSLEKIIHV